MIEQNKIKELEDVLKIKVKTLFSEITTDFEYERPKITLAISKLKITRCNIGNYIQVWNSGKVSCHVYISCDGCSWALNNVSSFSKEFESVDELDAYINSSQFTEDLKISDVWNYCINTEYRKIVIDTYTKEQLSYFEREFMKILENVGAKEILRILSPLNQIISYGGDFEAVSNFVHTLSNIIDENRNLKLKYECKINKP